MIDERAGKIIPIPEPKSGKGKPQPKLGPVIAKGETYDVCDIGGPVHGRLWTAKIVGIGSKEIVLTGDVGATALRHGMMVLLSGHPFLVHGFSQDRRQVVLRCLPKKAMRRYLETPEYDRDVLLEVLAEENRPPASEKEQVRELLAELEQATAEVRSKAAGEMKALLDQTLGGNDPGGLVQDELARRALTKPEDSHAG
jgi:hypothetical protein